VIRVTAPVAGEAPPPGAADPAAPPQGLEPPRLPLPALPDAAENGGDGAVSGYEIGALLESAGRAVLEGVAFETGSSRLSNGEEVPALEALAEYLKANPSRRVMLVGHTDASGRLEANIAISRSRARAVLEYLTGTLDVPAGQLSSDGVGYLMPLAPNLTEEGRARNRRVEAVLISTE
jgi:OOP family OmpA-OmpF porin